MQKNLKYKKSCKDCQHFNPKESNCYEGRYSAIGNPERELAPEDCSSFAPKSRQKRLGTTKSVRREFDLMDIIKCCGEYFLEVLKARIHTIIIDFK